MCQRAPKNEDEIPEWLADHIDDPVLISLVANGGWRYAAAFYRGMFVKACEREAEKNREIARLEAEVRQLKHQLFGRKSESQNTSDKVAAEVAKQDDSDTPNSQIPKRKRGAQPGHQGHPRKERPHLPRVSQSLLLTDQQKTCATCGCAYAPFPSRHSSRIEYKITIFQVDFEHERGVKTCQCPQSPPIVDAQAPPSVIAQSRYGTSVWLEVLLDKFYLHHPCNHFARAWGLLEGGISTGVLNSGLQRLVPLFEPIYEVIVERNQIAGFWHADETGWPVFGEPRKEHDRARWQLWVFRADDAVVYLIRPSRATEVPLGHFPPNVVGLLVVDRYSVYKKLANEYEGLILVFCWAHVRRDFFNAIKKYSELTEWAMTWIEAIGELYKLHKARAKKLEEHAQDFPELCLEAKVIEVAINEQRALEGQAEKMKKRLGEELRELEKEAASKEAKASQKAKAKSPKEKRQRRQELAHQEEKGRILRSLNGHWCGLTLFLDYPDVPLDNNSGERALRGGAVARKSYYGSGAQWSIHLTEMLFSLFATLEQCFLNPRTWLSHYLDFCATKRGEIPSKEEVREWMPWNMSEERRKEMSQPVGMPPPDQKEQQTRAPVNGADAISIKAN